MDIKDDKRLRRLYSKHRLIKNVARQQERHLAKIIRKVDLDNLSENNKKQIENGLERILTWKLKVSGCAEPMWCDGTRITDLVQTKNRRIEIAGYAWIGPESDVKLVGKCDMSGYIELDSNRKNFKAYDFNIIDDQVIRVAKNAI